MKFPLFIVCCIAIGQVASATNYYVDSTHGSDSGNGSISNSWKTISKVDSSRFSPGDVIAFACGGSWNGGFSVKQSGTAANPITFTKYGTGPAPSFTNPNYSVYNSNVIQLHAQYIVIDGLYFHDIPGVDTSSPDGHTSQVRTLAAVYAAADSGHDTIKNCEMVNVPRGISLYSQNNL